MSYLETSAKENIGVEQAFAALAAKAIERQSEL